MLKKLIITLSLITLSSASFAETIYQQVRKTEVEVERATRNFRIFRIRQARIPAVTEITQSNHCSEDWCDEDRRVLRYEDVVKVTVSYADLSDDYRDAYEVFTVPVSELNLSQALSGVRLEVEEKIVIVRNPLQRRVRGCNQEDGDDCYVDVPGRYREIPVKKKFLRIVW